MGFYGHEPYPLRDYAFTDSFMIEDKMMIDEVIIEDIEQNVELEVINTELEEIEVAEDIDLEQLKKESEMALKEMTKKMDEQKGIFVKECEQRDEEERKMAIVEDLTTVFGTAVAAGFVYLVARNEESKEINSRSKKKTSK